MTTPRRILRLIVRSLGLMLCALVLGPGLVPDIATSENLATDTLVVGQTFWDAIYGGTSCRRIATDSTGKTVIAWLSRPPGDGLQYSEHGYNIVSPLDVLEHGPTGCFFGGTFQTGRSDVHLGYHDSSMILVSAREEYVALYEETVPGCTWSEYVMISWSGGNRAHFANHAGFAAPFYHLLTRSTRALQEGLMYWRTPLGGQGRVVEPLPLPFADMPYTVAASPVSAKAAIGYIKDARVYYYESLDSGRTWGAGPGFGLRHDLGVTGAGHCVAMIYDFNGDLHFVYGDVAGGGNSVTLKHWSAAHGITSVYTASWSYLGTPTDLRNINYPQLSVGTGPRLNNLYLIWNQFGSAGSGADVAASGQLNGEVYMSISTNGGAGWDTPHNLTNTQSPGCIDDCANEILPSVDMTVDSLIRLTYLRDIEPGNTLNPVYYSRVATPEPQYAPILAGSPGAIGPLYFGLNRTHTTTAFIQNHGAGDLHYSFYDTLPWISFEGDLDSVAGVIPSGAGISDTVVFLVDATALSAGTYHGEFFISSNDPTIDGGTVAVDVIISDDGFGIVGTFRFGTGGGSNCWGWVGDDGTEYALMGTEVGVAIVDATNMNVIDEIPGPGPCGFTNRDIKTYRHYAYHVSECQGLNHGLLVIDLQYLPDSAHVVGNFVLGGQITSHNLSIDTVTGYAYLIGAGYTGFRIITLANPEQPIQIATAANIFPSHDLFARRDTVWVAEGTLGSFALWNMANKYSPVLIVRVTVPNAGLVHTIWPSQNGQYAVSTEETQGKTVKLWNTADKQNIQLMGSFLGPSQVAHNAHYEDSFVVISHYETGVRVLDVSNPAAPLEIGAFDTYPSGESPNFAGCWGVYPHTPSGRVYASNMDGFLYIFEFPELLTTCACDCHADPVCDGVRSSVQDVIVTIDVAFRNGTGTVDAACPMSREDVNCSGTVDIIDVVSVIDVAFRGANAAAEYCAPCL